MEKKKKNAYFRADVVGMINMFLWSYVVIYIVVLMECKK